MILDGGDPSTVEWELPVDLILQYSASAKLRSDDVELRVPVSPGLADVHLTAKFEAYVKDGSVSFFMCLPEGTKARWSQWVGPLRKKPRVLTDAWDKADRFFGSHSYGRVADHAKDGVVRLGFVLLVCLPPGGLPVASPSLQIGDQLGAGSFGEVRAAVAAATGRCDLVVKTSSRGESSNFGTEAVALQKLAQCPGIPEFIGHFRSPIDSSQEILVMARLHRNLESLRADPDIGPRSRLSPGTVVGIGVQFLTLLQQMHERDLVHMDLKPDNMMIGSGSGNVLYLIDFGLCRHWRVMGAHVPAKKSHLRGTARYCSVHAHQGLQSRRADIEALAYVLVYLAVGQLPWQGIGSGGSKKDRYDRMLEKKLEPGLLEEHTRKRLPDALPLADALCDMAARCRALEFEDEPPYDSLRSSLEAAVHPADAEHSPAHVFDWVADAEGRLTVAAELPGRHPSGRSRADGGTGFQTTAAATRGRHCTSGADRSGYEAQDTEEWHIGEGAEREGESKVFSNLVPDTSFHSSWRGGRSGRSPAASFRNLDGTPRPSPVLGQEGQLDVQSRSHSRPSALRQDGDHFRWQECGRRRRVRQEGGRSSHAMCDVM